MMFRRLLGVSKNRDIDLKTVLQHELPAVPPSLFHDDGTLRKSTKSDLAAKLESNCTEIVEISDILTTSTTSFLFDGMTLLQQLNEAHFQTFNDLGNLVLQRLLAPFKANRTLRDVTIVIDRYRANSIKNMERNRRNDSLEGASHTISGQRAVPNYRRY